MEGNLDAFDFILAERLGKTLTEVRDMPNAEHIQWRAFFKYRKAMAELG